MASYHPILPLQHDRFPGEALEHGLLQPQALGRVVLDDWLQLLVISNQHDLLNVLARHRNQRLGFQAHAALVHDALHQVVAPLFEFRAPSNGACAKDDLDICLLNRPLLRVTNQLEITHRISRFQLSFTIGVLSKNEYYLIINRSIFISPHFYMRFVSCRVSLRCGRRSQQVRLNLKDSHLLVLRKPKEYFHGGFLLFGRQNVTISLD